MTPQGDALRTPTTRQATDSDLGAVAVLFDRYRQFYKSPPNIAGAEAFLAERMRRGESVIFIAELAGRAVGFTQLYPSFSSVSMAPIFILNDLYVDASARRQGVAAQLLDAATAYAQSKGAVRVSLNTDVQNAAAQATYEALGWEKDLQYFSYHFHLKD